jgi:hypothetical protein
MNRILHKSSDESNDLEVTDEEKRKLIECYIPKNKYNTLYIEICKYISKNKDGICLVMYCDKFRSYN